MAAQSCERCGSPVRAGARYCFWCGIRHPWALRIRIGARGRLGLWAGLLAALAIGLIVLVVVAFQRGDNEASRAAGHPNTADGLRDATIAFGRAVLEAEQGRNLAAAHQTLSRACRERWSVADFQARLTGERDRLRREYGIGPEDLTIGGAEVRDVTDGAGRSYPIVASERFPDVAARINADAGFTAAVYEDGDWHMELCET